MSGGAVYNHVSTAHAEQDPLSGGDVYNHTSTTYVEQDTHYAVSTITAVCSALQPTVSLLSNNQSQ